MCSQMRMKKKKRRRRTDDIRSLSTRKYLQNKLGCKVSELCVLVNKMEKKSWNITDINFEALCVHTLTNMQVLSNICAHIKHTHGPQTHMHEKRKKSKWYFIYQTCSPLIDMPQPYTKNYRKLMNAEGKRNRFFSTEEYINWLFNIKQH